MIAAVREAFLLADLIVIPTGSVQFRQDVFSTGVGFSDHAKIDNPCQIVSGGFYAIRWRVAKAEGLAFGISNADYKL
jgi:hypothetical protein